MSLKEMKTAAVRPSDLKTENRRTVLMLLRREKLMTISEIAAVTGMSRTTALKTVDFLVNKGYVCSAGKGASTTEGGKKPELYSVSNDFSYVLCIDVSENALEGTVFNMDGELTDNNAKCRIGISEKASVENIADNVFLAFRLLSEKMEIKRDRISSVMIGCDRTDDAEKLRGPVKKRLEGIDDVRIDARIRFAAFSETEDEDGENRGDMCALNAGGNGGCCVLYNGRVFGRRGLSTHQIIDMSSEEICPKCGRRGCFESLVSVCGRLGADSAQDVFEAANTGIRPAQEKLEKIIDAFSVYICNMALAQNVGTFVLFGEYSTAGTFFYSQLRMRVEKLLPGRTINIIAARKTMTASMLAGAAKYASESFFENEKTYAE